MLNRFGDGTNFRTQGQTLSRQLSQNLYIEKLSLGFRNVFLG